MSRETTITGPLKDLADAVGGVLKLAAILKISPATLWRWGSTGKKPAPSMQREVNTLAESFGLPPPFPGVGEPPGL